jgi:hypothetical protein
LGEISQQIETKISLSLATGIFLFRFAVLGENAVSLPSLQSFQTKMAKIGWIVFFAPFLTGVFWLFSCVSYLLKSFDNIIFHYTPHLALV